MKSRTYVYPYSCESTLLETLPHLHFVLRKVNRRDKSFVKSETFICGQTFRNILFQFALCTLQTFFNPIPEQTRPYRIIMTQTIPNSPNFRG